MRLTIPINADLGEGMGNDAQLMPFLSSCNIACGGHTGDRASMMATAQLAKRYKVAIGAHPSFQDKENFGRKVLKIPAKQLTQSIYNQVLALANIGEQLSFELNHIKPHGALYNLAANDYNTAMAVLEAIDKLPKKLTLYTLPNSKLSKLAQTHFKVKHEGFLDRRYLSDGSLMPRSEEGAVLIDKSEIWQQCKNLWLKKRVAISKTQFIPLKAETFCIHGDTPDIYNSLLFIKDQLSNLDS